MNRSKEELEQLAKDIIKLNTPDETPRTDAEPRRVYWMREDPKDRPRWTPAQEVDERNGGE